MKGASRMKLQRGKDNVERRLKSLGSSQGISRAKLGWFSFLGGVKSRKMF